MLPQGLAAFLTVIVICNGADIQWEAKVKTSDVDAAGTNAGVFMQIIGTDGTTPDISLDNDDVDDMERGGLDTFVFTTADVGTPIKVRVWHSNTNSAPGWHLDNIILKGLKGKYARTFIFDCDCWLAIDVDGVDRTIPVAKIQWQAQVKTSDYPSAGTNAKVFIQIIGEEGGRTMEFSLNEHDSSDMARGAMGTFVFNATDVGTPTKLRVWHDNAGSGPGWHLGGIELEAMNGEYTDNYVFNCDCWLATDQVNDGIERVIPVDRMIWKARLTTSNTEGAASDGQGWVTIYGETDHTRQIYLNHDGDDFARGVTDVYMIQTIEIGKPTMIIVHTDNADSWHLDKIVLENTNGAEMYTFICDCWLGRGYKTIKAIPLSS